jgi:hypothetical protein
MMLTDVTLPVPSARRMWPVLTRTIRGPRLLRYRVTRKRWIPVAVALSRATPSKMTCARARCWAGVSGMQEAYADEASTNAAKATAV